MLSGLELALVAAALVIGLTGAWSPCGFSMVETIGPTGHTGGRPTTFAALATFVPGALVGGVLTFGTLALLGELAHGAGGEVSYAIAAAIAILAAIAEARGLPIVPQIRRQLPEHWRRVMPMPVAAWLYGILLGLGFTTFVLSFGVWALAGISFAVGDPAAGIAIGVAFGAGRAIPVLGLAPVCDRPSGIRVTELMTQQPGIYRAFRAGDAAALVCAGAALVVATPAGAAAPSARGAGDPSASGADLAFERLGGGGVLRRGGREIGLPGTDPAVGGPFIAVRQGGQIALLGRRGLGERARVAAPGADALAVSRFWLAYRAREDGAVVIRARRIAVQSGGISPGGGVAIGEAATVAKAASPASLSPPSLFRGTLVYSRSSSRSSSVLARVLGRKGAKPLISSSRWLLSTPSVLGRSFAYVRSTNERQQLRVRKLGARGKGKVAFALPGNSFRDPDHGKGRNRLPTRVPRPDRRRTDATIGSTALAPGRVYVSVLRQRGGRVSSRIARFGR